MLNEKTFRKGSYLFLEGDEESGTVYLIKKGRVSHSCSSPMLSTALKDGREGDFIGFISSFSERPRISSAIAVEDTAAVQIDRDHFFRMLHEKHDIAMKIINAYSAVLKEYDNLLIDIKPISLLYPQSMSLLRLGEFYMENGDNILASYIFNRYIQLYPDSENITDVVKYLEDIESSSSAQPFKENDQGELFYNDKSVIFCEYEPGDNLYFIRDGKVKIIKQNKNRNILLAVLGPGDIFGELALIANAPRSATAISFGGAKLTPVDMDLFRELLSRSPEMIKKIIASISQRLWFNHIRLSHISYRNPVTRLFAFLESKLLEDGVSLSRKTPHLFQFGLDELIEMNELSYELNLNEINTLINNRFLSFNFGTISVLNPRDFSSEVQYYKQRDRLPALRRRSYKPEEETIDEETDSDNYNWTGTADISSCEDHELTEKNILDIIPDLNNEDPSKRVNAVIRLGLLGEKARSSVPHLKERLGDDVKIIRKNAARSIAKILTPGESLKLFKDAMKEHSQDVRSAAITGLGELDVADNSAIIGLLIKALSDQSPAVRSSAARSLGFFESEGEPAVPHLMKLLKDPDSSVRILSISSLEKIAGRGDYLNELINAAKNLTKSDTDRYVKNAARDVLIKLNRRKKRFRKNTREKTV